MAKGARTRRRSRGKVKLGPPLPSVGLPDALLSSSPALQQWSPRDQHVHMIGIGGSGMRGAAAMLLHGQATVSGSDRATSSALNYLSDRGVAIFQGQCAANLPTPCDLVVHSAAIKETNPELIAARQQGIRVVKYSELLGMLMADRLGVAIAGTHGKSTTTAMMSFVLREAGADPSFVIGAGVQQLGGSSGVGNGPHFVVEACEFNRSFLDLRPKFGTILNIEEDHLDYYRDLDEIIESFGAFASLIPAEGILVVNGEDRNAMRAAKDVPAEVQTFGFKGEVDFKAQILETEDGCIRFRVLYRGRRLTEVQLRIPGRHNVLNALAVMALCCHNGVEPERVAEIFAEFQGAHRRMTVRGQIAGVTVVDDYAHHPTEVQATLRAIRDFYRPNRMFVVFQPHQHSRTRFLLNDFARSFGAADVVVVPEIYFVRDSESERDKIGAQDLVERIHLNGGEARYEPDFGRIAAQLCSEVDEGDVVVTMGAGDVFNVASKLVECLVRHRGDAAPTSILSHSVMD